MAWKGRESGSVDYKSLESTLVNSGLQTDNPALYNAIKSLIGGAETFETGIKNSIKKTDKIDLKNQVSGSLLPVNGGADSLYYFPTLVPVSNIASSSAYYSHFLIFRKLVYISGKINVQPTAANVLTHIEFNLPIPSNFTTSDQLHGIINGISFGGGTSGVPGIITGNVSSGNASVQFYPPSTDNFDMRFMLSYERL